MNTHPDLERARRIMAPILGEALADFAYADTVATPQPRSGRRAGTTPSPQPVAISTNHRGGSRPHQGRTEQEHTPA